MILSEFKYFETNRRDANAVWGRIRCLISECLSSPEIDEGETGIQIAISKNHDNRFLVVYRKNAEIIIRHKHFDDFGNTYDLANNHPWGVIARIQGVPSREHSLLDKALVLHQPDMHEGSDAALDTSAPLTRKGGRISLVTIGRGKVTNTEQNTVVAIDAWWIEPKISAILGHMALLTKDIARHKQLAALDSCELNDDLRYGMFLPHIWAERNRSHVSNFATKNQSLTYPKGATNCRELDDVMHFTSDFELGQPSEYYLDKVGNWRPNVNESIIIMHYGQSNAGVNMGGGEIPGSLRCPYHVVNLDDGKGVRGHMGKPLKRSANSFVPAQQNINISIQSVVAVAGGVYLEERIRHALPPVQVIVRSEAKGGQPFIGKSDREHMPGIHKNELGEYSPCYHNLITSLRDSVRIAMRDGAPVSHIYIPFTHQEANRATSPEEYVSQAMDLFQDVEHDLADLNIPITWILDQASGTNAEGAGGLWPARLALEMLADQADNIFFLQPRYSYPMYDRSHWSNVGKVMYGELLGHAIAAIEAGKPMCAARVATCRRDGIRISLTFDSQSPLVFDEENHPVLNSVKGFTILGDPGLEIMEARLTGDRNLLVTLNREPTPDYGALLCYAYRKKTNGAEPNGWPYSTGALRETWQEQCRTFPDTKIYRWVPAFVVKI